MVRAILINATDMLGHHGCALVNRQIEALARTAQIEFVGRMSLHCDWSKQAPEAFDCIIVNGEGTLHSSSKGARRIADVPNWAKSRKLPAFLINSIYQGNSPDIDEDIKQFDAIWVRDQYSQQNMENFGVKAGYIPDLSLSWTSKQKTTSPEQIIVQDSSVRRTRDDLFAFSQQIGAKYLPLIARPRSYNAKISARRLKFQLRKRFSWALFPRERRVSYQNAIGDFDAFVDALSRCALLVSGRFHGITIALDLKIPFIAVAANSHKTRALLDSLSMTHRLVDNVEEAKSRLTLPSVVRFSAQELQSIDNIQHYTAERAGEMFLQIANETRLRRRIKQPAFATDGDAGYR